MLLGTKFLAFLACEYPAEFAAGFFPPPGPVLQLAGNSGMLTAPLSLKLPI
ncbi:hypothetical protein SLEP1_g3738 [Rubroshorea leprosula]|uniref:Uncharacterized protein n=1 Tax=Rubroshorea leprosula TaxID=152421 RepID=A0AAV5HX88_9ROSI|nr:hypothetical protein SLEP1_g3738 [Rubroshorea leprosula]